MSWLRGLGGATSARGQRGRNEKLGIALMSQDVEFEKICRKLQHYKWRPGNKRAQARGWC